MTYELEDKKLINPKYKNELYIFCIFLRTLFGIFLLYTGNDNLPINTSHIKKIKIILLILMIVSFLFTYMAKPLNWKCYPRNLLSNSLVLFLIYQDKTDLAAGLYLVDILNGIQSKHTKILIQAVTDPLEVTNPYKL